MAEFLPFSFIMKCEEGGGVHQIAASWQAKWHQNIYIKKEEKYWCSAYASIPEMPK